MLETDLDCWAYLLGNTERIDPDNPPEFLRRSSLEEAMSAMKVWTKEQLDGFQADKEFREEALYNTVRNVAMEKGLAEGLERGLAQGLEKGIAQGKTEGLAEGKKRAALAIAKDLLAMGISVQEIASITGLPPGDVVLS